jgi:hypothetical protein
LPPYNRWAVAILAALLVIAWLLAS